MSRATRSAAWARAAALRRPARTTAAARQLRPLRARIDRRDRRALLRFPSRRGCPVRVGRIGLGQAPGSSHGVGASPQVAGLILLALIQPSSSQLANRLFWTVWSSGPAGHWALRSAALASGPAPAWTVIRHAAEPLGRARRRGRRISRTGRAAAPSGAADSTLRLHRVQPGGGELGVELGLGVLDLVEVVLVPGLAQNS